MSDLTLCMVCGRPTERSRVSSLGRCWPCIKRSGHEHNARVEAERAAENAELARAVAEGRARPPRGLANLPPLRIPGVPAEAEQRPPTPVGPLRDTGNGACTPLLRERDSRYGLAALAEIAAEVARTNPGSRNDTLNIAWYACGRLGGAGLLTRATARQALHSAGLTSGLPAREVDDVLR